VREVHVARFHVVEFQKRGLPHAHLLLWLDDAREARDEVRDYIDCRVVGAHAAFLSLFLLQDPETQMAPPTATPAAGGADQVAQGGGVRPTSAKETKQ